MKVVGHRRRRPCPRCRKTAFCDDCGLCEACSYAPPEVISDADPGPPHPKPPCVECGGTVLHRRTCSITLRHIEQLNPS